MFAMIRRYESVGTIEVIALAAKEQFFPLFGKLPGFGSYTLVDTCDDGVKNVGDDLQNTGASGSCEHLDS